MRGKIDDLTGQTFGFLLVLEFAEIKNHHAYWRCRCLRCGNECVVCGNSLKRGLTTSCGRGCRNKTHGMTGTPIYRTWQDMLKRCEKNNLECFDDYGGRGIRVCSRWHIFQNFYDDVSILPHFGEIGYTLDRIDNDGDYEPGNVRWTDRKTQARNTRRNIKVVYNGVEMCLMDAAEISGIKYSTLRTRYRRGKRGDELFSPDNPRLNIVEYQGEEMSLRQASQKSGIPYMTLSQRYHCGLRGKDLFG